MVSDGLTAYIKKPRLKKAWVLLQAIVTGG